ncbi:MAG: hypothetical protein PHY72_01195 [Candidatus Pacebacteria bacterium]|nr:hypothetical protein [Candidatus Paceibacterota bacterium]
MATQQNINQPQEEGKTPAPENSTEPPQKISLVWVLFGIAGVLLMWFVSSKLF